MTKIEPCTALKDLLQLGIGEHANDLVVAVEQLKSELEL